MCVAACMVLCVLPVCLMPAEASKVHQFPLSPVEFQMALQTGVSVGCEGLCGCGNRTPVSAWVASARVGKMLLGSTVWESLSSMIFMSLDLKFHWEPCSRVFYQMLRTLSWIQTYSRSICETWATCILTSSQLYLMQGSVWGLLT